MKWLDIERIKYPALTFALSFGVLFYFFHAVLLAPNDFVFSSGGDGIKNYYTYMFHAKHDSGFWEFTGMNYPYYENVIYTDGHPLLSYLIGSLGLQNYAVGILNFLLLSSFPICSVFLYLILKNYRVESFWAIVAAIVLTFLTPQIFRFTGHLSLSYVFAIPGMWWILIKCNNARSGTLWAILSFLYVFSFFFTHPYLGIILSFFCLAFWFFVYITDRGLWKNAVGFVTVQLVIPFTIFRLLIFATDHHYNRMDIPAGFYNFFAGWGSILLPHHGPSATVGKMIGFRLNHWETWAYVGLPTIVFCLILIAYTIIKRKSLPFKLILKHELFLFFLAASAILVFSFCFPFKFSWFRWITDSIGPLKQFRILGRFAWIFYYVITISVVVSFFHMYKKQGKNLVLGAFFFLGLTYYLIESHEVNSQIADSISSSKNPFKPENLGKDTKDISTFLEAEKYDAFIMLPFTHMSSENMMLLGEERANFDAFMISYQTGLPMLNSVSSRMSQDESITFNNFFGPEFCEKLLFNDIPKKAKIAIIINDDYLSEDELRMVYSHEYVHQNDRYSVCTLNESAWNTDYYFNDLVNRRKVAVDSLKSKWTSDKNDWFYYESWDHIKGEGLKGKGAFAEKKGNYPFLAEISTDSIETGDYVVSFWYNHYVDRADISAITQFEYKGDSSDWAAKFDIKQSTHIVGHWMLVEMPFTVTEDVKKVNVYLTGNRSGEPYIIDELLIRKSDHHLFNVGKLGGKQYIIYDNYWIREDSFAE